MLTRKDKEALLSQQSICIWFTGLSGSGKSTLAIEFEKELHNRGFLVKLIDGDNVRTGINKNLGFSEEDRNENIRRIAEINKLFIENGIITINSFVSPTNNLRDLVKEIVGSSNYYLVYVNASLTVCEKRDVKGLYAKARKGEIPDFTGISAPFDEPMNAFLEINTSESDVKTCVNKLLSKFLPIIEYK
ncbi:MAG: adenylyl-sulfate kinase [Bacteroidia bacterium]|nr:adenylyl-sulfate kinase [Bacteroidia bacterium]